MPYGDGTCPIADDHPPPADSLMCRVSPLIEIRGFRS
jgi:hypothetical protein